MPPGGACDIDTARWTTLGPLSGWWMIPENERQYIGDGNSEQNVDIKCLLSASFPRLAFERVVRCGPRFPRQVARANHVQSRTLIIFAVRKMLGRA